MGDESDRHVIVIMGEGGQGRVILDALVASGRGVAGVLDDGPATKTTAGVQVLGGPDDWRRHLEHGYAFAVAMADRLQRRAIAEEILAAGGELVSTIHPAATLSPQARVGRGVAVLAGCVVGADAAIGDFTILNANCSVDHDCWLGTAVQFGPGVTLPGGVRCGDGAFVGAGATILPGVSIGSDAVVGAGSVVTKDVADGTVVAGNPARPLGG